MRIAWYSNSPLDPTGYGTQTAQVVRRMAADGHDVHVLCNHAEVVGIKDWDGVKLWAQGHAQYSLDVIGDQVEAIDPDYIFTLYDVWVLGNAWEKRKDRVISWTPVDHFPVPPQVLTWAKGHRTIAMSEFGQRALAQEGVASDYIPHALEHVFRPTPSDIRKRMQVPEDAFLVTLANANIGVTPPRKAWSENLHAMAVFMERHPDVYLYFHTDLMRPNGVPLLVLCQMLGLPADRLRKVDQLQYRIGLMQQDELAAIYTASDVLLACSKGEGFGLTTAEAMACGTPAIVSDFSAQPEIVGDTGWLVQVQPDYDHNQGADFCTPLIGGILAALEDAYAQRDSKAERGERCVARVRERYDADTVYEQKWRPLIASLEAPKRKGMSNAARRRAKKAKAA